VGRGPEYVGFYWRRQCYRLGDFVAMVGTPTIFKIEKIVLYLQLQDGLAWFMARPMVLLDEEERLLTGGLDRHDARTHLTRTHAH
jgi:hypothetical protein